MIMTMETSWFSLLSVVLLFSYLICCVDSSAVYATKHASHRERRSDDVNPQDAVVAQLTAEVTSLTARLEAAQRDFAAQLQAGIQEAKGSTFIRWGSSSCPGTSETVYSGVAGGSYYNDEGGSSNRLCLSLQPETDATNHNGDWYSTIYGLEYEFVADRHDYEAPCAVCKAVQASTVMIPGTKTCPHGWIVQYWGHLTGNAFRNHAAGEFICVDNNPEGRGSNRDDNNALMYYTVAKCGSLPCPPYTDDRVITCVVCSN